jgi:hypothetical protein
VFRNLEVEVFQVLKKISSDNKWYQDRGLGGKEREQVITGLRLVFSTGGPERGGTMGVCAECRGAGKGTLRV